MEKKYRDAIFGLAIGDALGVPYEFKSRGAFTCAGMTGFGTHKQPAGTWSDDTSMTIATAKSLRDNEGAVDIGDIRHNFQMWVNEEGFNCNGYLFDIGNATSTALSTGHGCRDENSNGNGSLMRILPLAFTDCTDDEIREVSAITHGHEISMEACVIYVHVARRLLDGEPIGDILPTLQYGKPFGRLCRLDQLTEDEIRSGGYVVDTLEASLWVLAHSHDFREAVLAAVNLGGDTDTTGAVCGGLAGIAFGLESDFAGECMEQLRGKELIEECLPEEKDPLVSFSGKKCCLFADEIKKWKYASRLTQIKEYDEVGESWYADHLYHSLWQCSECGAVFLLDEVEQTSWSGENDTFRDDYYQVESKEHADRLVSKYGRMFGVYEGPAHYEK
ncbi:MAG: ADP-ribosylglycohydrolase family protein [Firmicutes bacterium]|nr:ADP-ribosylglycohydrolase family protein [Bacillota bacterium]